jgi:hypothetical protein
MVGTQKINAPWMCTGQSRIIIPGERNMKVIQEKVGRSNFGSIWTEMLPNIYYCILLLLFHSCVIGIIIIIIASAEINENWIELFVLLLLLLLLLLFVLLLLLLFVLFIIVYKLFSFFLL